MFVSSNRSCKCGEDIDPGICAKCIQEFILDTTVGQESVQSSEAPILLRLGAGSDSGLLVSPSVSDSTHDVISIVIVSSPLVSVWGKVMIRESIFSCQLNENHVTENQQSHFEIMPRLLASRDL